jgi:hypothetical protein
MSCKKKYEYAGFEVLTAVSMERCLLGNASVLSGRCPLAFRRNIIPSSSCSKDKPVRCGLFSAPYLLQASSRGSLVLLLADCRYPA